MDADVLIVGAGAAGLWAAGTAAARGAQVVVLEKTPRAGSKVLASGGSRCNLTTTLGPREAAAWFGDGARFLAPAFGALPPGRVRERFADLDVPTVVEEHLEKVFPASQRAVDVRDALLRRTGAARLVLGEAVVDLVAAEGGWAVHTERRTWRAPQVILATGGRSYPRTGTTGDGYAWLTKLGLPVNRPVPALVPLTSPAGWVRDLAGIDLQRVEARLVEASGRVLWRRARPIVFSHVGLSGPGAMDLSSRVARASAEGRAAGLAVLLDLVPDLAEATVRERLVAAASTPGGPRLQRAVGESLPGRLWAAVVRQAGLSNENPAVCEVPRSARNRLVEALKGLRVPVDGTLGWDRAEVTAGGLDLSAVDPKTMAVRACPGLHVCGELLDLDGPIGGFHFQLAFATGELAALAATRPR